MVRIAGQSAIARFLRPRSAPSPEGCPAGSHGRTAGSSAAASGRRAITLIELLVVIAIIGILAGFALREMRLGVEERGIREAARALNVYLGSARNRAMELGRPAGVVIERSAVKPNAAILARQVEAPPPYAGDTVDARIVLSGAGGNTWAVSFGPSPAAGLSWDRLVNNGDLLQLNFQGPYYVIQMPDGANKRTIKLLNTADMTSGPRLPSDVLAAGLPFQVFPRPISAGVTPLKLSTDSVIDLQFSGLGDPSNATLFSAEQAGPVPIYIMFSPNGGVDRVYAGAFNGAVTQPIYLLIGRAERIPAGTSEDGLDNWQDGNNLWVTINAQTGLVVTSPVAGGMDVIQAREFAMRMVERGGR